MRSTLASPLLPALVLSLLISLGACGEAGKTADPSPTPGDPTHSTDVPTAPPTRPAQPCEPAGGFPVAVDSCPDPEALTGWLTARPGVHRDGGVVIAPFRTLGSDAEGRAYAEERGLEFPFSNDYFDAPTGPSRALRLDPDTVCTGIILVGYREPLEDHVVDCAELADAATGRRVPVAVWRDGGRVVQVSELYRP